MVFGSEIVPFAMGILRRMLTRSELFLIFGDAANLDMRILEARVEWWGLGHEHRLFGKLSFK